MSAASISAVLRGLAQADPELPALIDGDQTISRGRLDGWSDAVAAHLAREGVRAGDIVPLQLETSPALIAAALGVLKLGAVYAVMDPQWSPRRLRRIDEILGGALALAGPGRASGCFRREVEPPGFAAPAPDPAWAPNPAPDTRVATVFFTSGSTGEPKAVLSTHDAILRLFTGAALAHYDPEIVMPHLGSSAWDVLPLEVWGPLLNGGVCVLRRRRALTPAELRGEIREHGVNTVFLTTSLFNVLVDEDVAAFEGLRAVYCGGEECSPAHAARFLAAHPDIPLYNAYGPVESTCYALTHRVTLEDTRGPVPLGRPVPRTGVHVLDGERECAPDEVGELCISGDGLSPGYLGDDALTAAKFVEATIGGRRLRVYRTGDYGALTSGGLFTFAGRLDRELKIRGHRIDAGQIERTAAGFAAVARCAVVPLPGPSGRPESLALAVVPSAEHHLDEKELRGALERALPPGWCPDTVVRLATLPLTGNGKLDTAALHAALAQRAADRTRSEADREDPEDPLVAAFSRVLGGIPVDPEATLFELGGTSLAAVRLCVALSRATGLSIPVTTVLTHPSVNAMRAWIAGQSAAEPEPTDHTVADAPSPLTGMQSGFLFQNLDGKDGHNNSYSAWRITGALELERFVEALQDVHARHAYLHGIYSFADKAMWNRCERPVTVEYLDAPDEQAALAGLREALHRPFSLFDGDVWRAVLGRLEGGEQWLFGMAVHHIAFDGWSVPIFTEDLAEAYGARCAGREARFAHPVAAPSAIYAEMERIRGLADLPGQLDHWAKELAGLPDGPAPWLSASPCPDIGVRKIDVGLAPDQAQLLHRRSRGSGLLPTFIAALGATLVELTGAEDFTVGMPVSQRSTPVLQDTIACLINTMCIRLRACADGDFAAEAEKAVLAGMRNNDPSISEVARAAGLAGRQLFHVIGAVQDSPTADLRLEGCVAEPIELPYSHLAVPLVVDLVVDEGAASIVRVLYDCALVAGTMAHNVSAGVVRRLTQAAG
ncbi:AMP-binding protein [Actinospica durhamensis]|uniref:AMP-binding protein n=1 Tax=Actinospica durhamensis TaxID=1508375 RepID=A0A941EQZ1_9ACTN|nr:AMP-binding protein [Actinospica durhamensis]MBR7834888.1 AMP-binding protein [Actinospica durhamensis]